MASSDVCPVRATAWYWWAAGLAARSRVGQLTGPPGCARARPSRTDTCTFSNYRIYPYHGVTYIRVDGKVCFGRVALALPRRGEDERGDGHEGRG